MYISYIGMSTTGMEIYILDKGKVDQTIKVVVSREGNKGVEVE